MQQEYERKGTMFCEARLVVSSFSILKRSVVHELLKPTYINIDICSEVGITVHAYTFSG
jgi:hypothetical protein